MMLSTKAWALTTAIIMAASLLIVGLLNLAFPSYGTAFLEIFRSMYPGYRAMTGFAAVIVGTIYAAVDGLVFGFLIAWVYNKLVGARAEAHAMMH